MELEIKQWIIYRRDLKMRKGKIAAQSAHASMAVFFRRRTQCFDLSDSPDNRLGVWQRRNRSVSSITIPLTEEMQQWVEGSFGKVVLSVENLEDLEEIKRQADEAGLPTAMITDAGRTEFHGVPTVTCIAIGPCRCQDAWPIVRDGNIETKLA